VGVILGPHIKGGTQIEGVWEQGADQIEKGKMGGACSSHGIGEK